jgi:5'-nucleotidase
VSDEERWMQTFTGRVFPLETFDPDAIGIEDIAHALGMLCRFQGQCQKFYSVAEHSVHVSHEIEPNLALLGLMHDAAEAYLGDVPTPLKKSMPGFQQTEDELMKLISEKFGFVFPEKDTVEEVELKRADMQLLADEKEVVMGREPKPWSKIFEVKNSDRIQCWSPGEAKDKFLERFRELTS